MNSLFVLGAGLLALIGLTSAVVFPAAQQTQILAAHNTFRTKMKPLLILALLRVATGRLVRMPSFAGGRGPDIVQKLRELFKGNIFKTVGGSVTHGGLVGAAIEALIDILPGDNDKEVKHTLRSSPCVSRSTMPTFSINFKCVARQLSRCPLA
ncbi:unnamed protein product, partial [Mesorhabditis spiculigera]